MPGRHSVCMSSDQDEVTPHAAADAAADAAAPAGEAPAAVAVLSAEDGTLSRRQVLVGAGGASLLAATPAPAAAALTRPQRQPAASDGTPEQVHLTWGRDPATSMTVSWASPEPAVKPRLHLAGPGEHPRMVPVVLRSYTDGISGEPVWTYHA